MHLISSKIFLFKINLSKGIGHWALASFASKMMHERHYEEPNGNKTILPAILKPNFALARNCIVPPCHLCLLAPARKRTLNILRTRLLDNREGAITIYQYNIGDFISTDQFICKMPRCLPTGYGRKSQDCHF
jgi:hypothetical protein